MLSRDLTSQIEVIWDQTSAEDWGRMISTLPYTAYQQTYGYGDVLIEMGGRLHRAEVRMDGQTIALAQIQFRRFLGCLTVALVIRGPVWLDPTLEASHKALLYKGLQESLPIKGPFLFLIMPEEENDKAEKGGGGLHRIMSGYHTVMIGLQADEEKLRSQLIGKWRNRLRAAEKAGISVTQAGKNPDRYKWLLEKEKEQQVRSGYRGLPLAMVPLYQEHLGKESVLVLEARQGTDRIGGMLFLRHGAGATYHIGWANEVGKSVNVHNLLLWQAILALKKRGVRTLDLGGVNTDENVGLARFKLGTGGNVHSLSGTWTSGIKWR